MEEFFKNKNIVVTGGTGTIGKRIIEMLLDYSPKVIRVFSRDEHKQFEMNHELGENDNIRFFLGDVRDYERLLRATKNADIIFHLAAFKHVPACEYNPFEAVQTNVIGTQNVIRAAIENEVEKVVFTSTDKAISPTNAMGATKLLAERLIASANYSQGTKKPIFCAVRFGNVMGSRGSVIPLFIKQIVENKKITLTNSKMSRFMMSISDAAHLTMKAVKMARGGEIYVLKMPVVNLEDMSEVVIEEVCKKYSIEKKTIKVENIGLRYGEKMFEELMTIDESRNAYDLGDMFVVLPSIPGKNYEKHYRAADKVQIKNYLSEDDTPITKEEIRDVLTKEKLI